jgi:hypothetical protein
MFKNKQTKPYLCLPVHFQIPLPMETSRSGKELGRDQRREVSKPELVLVLTAQEAKPPNQERIFLPRECTSSTGRRD